MTLEEEYDFNNPLFKKFLDDIDQLNNDHNSHPLYSTVPSQEVQAAIDSLKYCRQYELAVLKKYKEAIKDVEIFTLNNGPSDMSYLVLCNQILFEIIKTYNPDNLICNRNILSFFALSSNMKVHMATSQYSCYGTVNISKKLNFYPMPSRQGINNTILLNNGEKFITLKIEGIK